MRRLKRVNGNQMGLNIAKWGLQIAEMEKILSVKEAWRMKKRKIYDSDACGSDWRLAWRLAAEKRNL